MGQSLATNWTWTCLANIEHNILILLRHHQAVLLLQVSVVLELISWSEQLTSIMSSSKGLQRSGSDRPTVDWETLFEAAPISHPEGMQRSKSIVEFQQLMRQDAQAALRSELDRLIDNAQPDDKDFFANEFNSFANLFERFLQERGPSIEWEKIRPPAEGMVSFKTCMLKYNEF
jgi:hypothetical protein